MHKSWWWVSGIVAGSLAVTGLLGATYAATGSSTATSTSSQSHTITVLGSAWQSNQGSSANVMVNVNLNQQGQQNPSTLLSSLQHQSQALVAALEKTGISAGNITVTNQNLNMNGQFINKANIPPAKRAMVSSKPTYNGNEAIQVTVPAAKESAVLGIVASQLSSGFSGGFNVYINQQGASNPNASSTTLTQAMQAAQTEAAAVAGQMHATLGPVIHVNQVSYRGPIFRQNQTMIQLAVTYQVSG